MPTKQSEHTPLESTLVPHNPDNWSTSIPDYRYGLYRKITGIGGI